jgi:transposase-like protein
VAVGRPAGYPAVSRPEAEQTLSRFAKRCDTTYPTISPSWFAGRQRLTRLLDYPPALQRLLYVNNAIEALHSPLRQRLTTRGAFLNNASIVKSCTWHNNTSHKGGLDQCGTERLRSIRA